MCGTCQWSSQNHKHVRRTARASGDSSHHQIHSTFPGIANGWSDFTSLFVSLLSKGGGGTGGTPGNRKLPSVTENSHNGQADFLVFTSLIGVTSDEDWHWDQWAPGGVRGSSSLILLKGPRHVCWTHSRHNFLWFGPHGRILNTEEDYYHCYCVIVEMCSKRCCVGAPASEGC